MKIHIPFTGISFNVKWSHLFISTLAIFGGVSAYKESADSSVEIMGPTQPQSTAVFGTTLNQMNFLSFSTRAFQIQNEKVLLYSDPDIILLSSRTCPRELTKLNDRVYMRCYHEPTRYGSSSKENKVKDAISCSVAKVNLKKMETDCELLAYLETFNNRLQREAQEDDSSPIRVLIR